MGNVYKITSMRTSFIIDVPNALFEITLTPINDTNGKDVVITLPKMEASTLKLDEYYELNLKPVKVETQFTPTVSQACAVCQDCADICFLAGDSKILCRECADARKEY